MRTLAVMLLLLASPTFSADFRGTAFGSSCSSVDAREKSLGSVHVSWSWSDPNFHTYSGHAFDRDVYILYLCNGGVMNIGEYLFPKRKYDDAVGDFLVAYGHFSGAYGSPFIKYGEKGTAMPMFPSVGSAEPKEYHASWKADGLLVHVDLVLDGNRAGQSWVAMVVISQELRK
jgi:hypothetical protein